MIIDTIIRVCIMIAGLVLFGISITSLAKRKMTEPICLIWGGVSFLVFMAGLLLRPVLVKNMISTTGLILVSLVIFFAICGAYFLSTMVSDLTRKNQELAIQVSLLKRQSEILEERIEKLEGEHAHEEDTNHN